MDKALYFDFVKYVLHENGYTMQTYLCNVSNAYIYLYIYLSIIIYVQHQTHSNEGLFEMGNKQGLE